MAKTAKPAAKKEEKEKGPKKPQSAYMFFAAAERPKLKAEKPDTAQSDVMKLIAERWSTVSDKEKEKFEALAAADRERFESEGGKKAKDKSGPKKPSSAYIFFCNDQRATVKAANPALAAKEIVSELGAEWKKLDASEKKKYEDMAAADKKRYEAEKKCVDSAGRLWVGGNTRPDNSDDHVYPSFLYVLNASTGALIVQLTDGYFGAITTSILLTSDGTAVFGTSARQGVSTDMAAVYAVWPNCTLRWEFFTGGPQPGNFVGSPTEAPDGSVIYVAATNGIVYTVNASSRNGASYAVFATTGSMYDPWTVTASPAASSDGTVYFASNPIGSGPGSDGALFAVHADGTALWNFSFPGDGVGGGRSGSAAVISPDGSTVYISADAGEGSGGSLYALNARDGSLLWEAPGSFSGLSSSPVLAGDVLYAGGGIANTLFAINATTGTQVWNLSTVAPYGIYVDIGIGGDGTLYLTNAGSLVAISDAGGAA